MTTDRQYDDIKRKQALVQSSIDRGNITIKENEELISTFDDKIKKLGEQTLKLADSKNELEKSIKILSKKEEEINLSLKEKKELIAVRDRISELKSFTEYKKEILAEFDKKLAETTKRMVLINSEEIEKSVIASKKEATDELKLWEEKFTKIEKKKITRESKAICDKILEKAKEVAEAEAEKISKEIIEEAEQKAEEKVAEINLNLKVKESQAEQEIEALEEVIKENAEKLVIEKENFNKKVEEYEASLPEFIDLKKYEKKLNQYAEGIRGTYKKLGITRTIKR